MPAQASDGSPLAAEVIGCAAALELRIAVAESLTGGLLASTLVGVPGASVVFSGGVVAYDTALKRLLLGVDGGLLERSGPVHPEVAMQMARGVRRACAVPEAPGPKQLLREADLGIATTGVAGPDADPQSGQAPGTVWLGVSSHAGERALKLNLTGDRRAIRELTVQRALEVLLAELHNSQHRSEAEVG